MGILNVSKNKNLVGAFVLGILFAIFVGHAYIVYQTRAITLQNSNDIAQIAAFLQQASAGASAGVVTSTGEDQ